MRPLPGWSSNRGKRLTKSPKIHLVDCGLAAHLAGLDATTLAHDRPALGPLLEFFVFGELIKQASWAEPGIALYHFRTAAGREVDIVLDGPGGRVVLLYDGDAVVPFGERMVAAPVQALWEA